MGTFSRPVWTEEGPGPLALPTAGYSKAAGAVQAVASDPVDVDRVFVAAVGGGIWRSTNAVSAKDPTWIPLTDQQPSLSMSAIVFNPLDANRNTLFAGCGATSHSQPTVGPNSGPLLGLLKTNDGGQTWTEFARSTFQGLTITRILPTLHSTQQGQLLLVATWGGGLLRSADGGQTWLKVGSLGGDDHVSDVVADPGDPMRIYASTWKGVFRSDDGGDQNWSNVSAGLGKLPPYPVIKFSFSKVADQNGRFRLYAVVANWDTGSGLFFTTDDGANWLSLGVPPDRSMPAPPMTASPLRTDIAFCASDNGMHWMVTAGLGKSPAQWLQLDLSAAAGAPHTDGRDCAFGADPNVLFETDDGGIYRLVNALGTQQFPAREWQAAVGNLRVAEFHAIAYDSVNHILFGATQDNSVPQQTARDGIDWGINEDPWGDGFEVGVDNTGVQGASVHYSSQQSLFHAHRRMYTSPTQVTQDVGIPFIINGTGGLGYNVVEGALRDDGSLGSVRWNQTWAINAVDGKRMLLGTDYLYESFDRGDTFDSLGGLTTNKKGEWIPDNPVGSVSAYAYGHKTNPDVIYIGAAGKLLLRSAKQGLPTEVVAYPGSAPVGIAIGPGSWQRAFVLDALGHVFDTRDGGASWRDLTGNLASLTGDLRAVEVFAPAYPIVGEVIFVAGYGGVFVCKNPGSGKLAFWQKHGSDFPNAVVTGLHYSAADDVLIAGTLGRGAFSLKAVTETVVGGPALKVKASQGTDCMGGWVADSTVTFSAVITDAQDLVGPLTYDWTAQGVTNELQAVPWQLKATMPGPGQEVDIALIVTDATGYKLYAALSQDTVTQEEAILRAQICALIAWIRGRAIFKPPPYPEDGPFPLGDDLVTREELTEISAAVRELGQTLDRLLQEGTGRVVRTLPARRPDLERQVENWRRAYPTDEHAEKIIPLRANRS